MGKFYEMENFLSRESGLSGLSGFYGLFGKNNLVNYLAILLKSQIYPSDSQS